MKTHVISCKESNIWIKVALFCSLVVYFLLTLLQNKTAEVVDENDNKVIPNGASSRKM